MSSTLRAFLVVGALLASACVVSLLTFDSFCKLDATSKFPSSSSAYLATVESFSCLLPNELRTTVLISSQNKSLYGGVSPLVFVATPPDWLNGTNNVPVPVHLEWFGDDELRISYPKGTRVRSQMASVNNINILFKEVAQTAP